MCACHLTVEMRKLLIGDDLQCEYEATMPLGFIYPLTHAMVASTLVEKAGIHSVFVFLCI